MNAQANKAVVRQWFAETLGRVDVDTMARVMDQVFSPNFVDHDGPDPSNSREALKAVLSAFLRGSQLQFTIEQLIAENDLVAVRVRGQAKHTGPIMGVPPTGKTISWTENEIFRFEDGQIVESWGEGTLEEALASIGLAFKARQPG